MFSFWLLIYVWLQVFCDGVCFFMFLFILFLIKEIVTQIFAIFCYLRGPLFCWSPLLLVPVFLLEQCASDGVDCIPDSRVCCVSWPGQSKHCILFTPVIRSAVGMWPNWCELDAVASDGGTGRGSFLLEGLVIKVEWGFQEPLRGAWYWNPHSRGLS